jgi:hypothetical protein
MNRQTDCTLSESLLDTLAQQGLDALPELFRVLLNAAMHAERQKYLNAAPHKRSPCFPRRLARSPTAFSFIAIIPRPRRMFPRPAHRVAPCRSQTVSPTHTPKTLAPPATRFDAVV